jgi:hypothetical protein
LPDRAADLTGDLLGDLLLLADEGVDRSGQQPLPLGDRDLFPVTRGFPRRRERRVDPGRRGIGALDVERIVDRRDGLWSTNASPKSVRAGFDFRKRSAASIRVAGSACFALGFSA